MGGNKGVKTDYDFTDEERLKLTRNVNLLDTPHLLRPTYKQNPTEFIRLHREAGCRVEHCGQILVHGQGFEPGKIRAERGRR